jgi:hypothetical protein
LVKNKQKQAKQTTSDQSKQQSNQQTENATKQQSTNNLPTPNQAA